MAMAWMLIDIPKEHIGSYIYILHVLYWYVSWLEGSQAVFWLRMLHRNFLKTRWISPEADQLSALRAAEGKLRLEASGLAPQKWDGKIRWEIMDV